MMRMVTTIHMIRTSRQQVTHAVKDMGGRKRKKQDLTARAVDGLGYD